MTKSQGLVPKKILEGQVWCVGRQWGDHPWMWKTRQVTRLGWAQGWAIPWWVTAPSPCQSSGQYRSIAGSKQLSCRRSQGTLPTPLLHWKWKWKLLSRVRLLATPWIVHGILQARILEWVAFPFSRGSSQPRDQTQVSGMTGRFFISWAAKEALFPLGPSILFISTFTFIFQLGWWLRHGFWRESWNPVACFLSLSPWAHHFVLFGDNSGIASWDCCED